MAAVCGVPRSWTRLKQLSSSRARRVLRASQVALVVKNPPANEETEEVQVRSLDWEDPLEQEMAPHFSTLAWKIPWAEEPGGLQSMGRKELDTAEHVSAKGC